MSDPAPTLASLASDDALSRLQGVLLAYAGFRRIPAAQALDRQGRNLSIKLTSEFMKVAPKDSQISLAARGREWRMGRDNPAEGGPENTGFSHHTLKRVRAMMGGHRSILARVLFVDGRVKVTPVALGAMSRRTGLRKRVRYKPGRTVGVSGRADQRFTLKSPDDKVLNFRALGTIVEMNLRESGRRFLAISWMYRRWRKLAPSNRVGEPGKREWRKLETRNPRSRLDLLGEIVMEEGAPGAVARDVLRLSSFVPGVAEVGKNRGVFNRAMDGVSEDMAKWMAGEESKRLAANIAKAVSA